MKLFVNAKKIFLIAAIALLSAGFLFAEKKSGLVTDIEADGETNTVTITMKVGKIKRSSKKATIELTDEDFTFTVNLDMMVLKSSVPLRNSSIKASYKELNAADITLQDVITVTYIEDEDDEIKVHDIVIKTFNSTPRLYDNYRYCYDDWYDYDYWYYHRPRPRVRVRPNPPPPPRRDPPGKPPKPRNNPSPRPGKNPPSPRGDSRRF